MLVKRENEEYFVIGNIFEKKDKFDFDFYWLEIG